LLDTSIVSRGVGAAFDLGVVEHLRVATAEAALGAPVWHELNFGLQSMPPGRRREVLEKYLDVVRDTYPILPYDEVAATVHASERARLRRVGRTPPFADGQIAAIAIVNELIMVTANVRDFRSFEGLTIEDWSSPQP